MKKELFVLMAIIGMIVLSCGCVEESTEGVEDETIPTTGSLSFYIADDYVDDFEFINVTFSEIKIHNRTEVDEESWIYINMDPKKIDLKELHDLNVSALINTIDIKIGNYTKLWINVTNATGILAETGENINFTVPSGWLKIQQLHLFNITKGNHSVTVNIDLNKSIKNYHGGTEWKLTPVISSISHKHENQIKFEEKDDSKIKNIANSPPVIDIVVNDNPLGKSRNVDIDADTAIWFNASNSYDSEGSITNYTWDFGDSIISYESDVTHSFEDSIIPYKVTLTIKDESDNESTQWFNVHINKTN
jgi:hypothetical protein